MRNEAMRLWNMVKALGARVDEETATELERLARHLPANVRENIAYRQWRRDRPSDGPHERLSVEAGQLVPF